MQQRSSALPLPAGSWGPVRTAVFALGLTLVPACGGSGSSAPAAPSGGDASPVDAGPGGEGEEEASTAPPTPAASPEGPPAAAPPEAPEDALSPASLYAECRDRVEGREKDGECATDADCAKAGCSSEVCVTATLAPEVMTTCEARPCFAVLDTCGCVEGRCSWSLAQELPPGMGGTGAAQLPAKDGAPASGGGEDLPQ